MPLTPSPSAIREKLRRLCSIHAAPSCSASFSDFDSPNDEMYGMYSFGSSSGVSLAPHALVEARGT